MRLLIWLNVDTWLFIYLFIDWWLLYLLLYNSTCCLLYIRNSYTASAISRNTRVFRNWSVVQRRARANSYPPRSSKRFECEKEQLWSSSTRSFQLLSYREHPVGFFSPSGTPADRSPPRRLNFLQSKPLFHSIYGE